MTVTQSPDTERVLGQIARGEVVAGREAARRIAARHQEAYGNAVWGPPAGASTGVEPGPSADDFWADALASLGGEAP